MDWSKGFTASYYASVVSAETWHEVDKIMITNGTIKRSNAELRESAEIECTRYDQTEERWIRIWMDARQGGDNAHVPMFTGVAVSPDRNINGLLTTNTVQCFSVLKPAQDVLLPRGWYAPAGSNGAELVADLLAVTPAPKIIEGVAPTLQEAYIAENGESNLSMANKILQAIGWRIRIDGDGTISIMSEAVEPSVVFGSVDYDVLQPEIKVTYDWYSAPNVFRATMDDVSAVARDEDADSIFSIPNRGREIWKEERGCKLSDSESLAGYALRRLKEEQRIALTASYDRRYHPDITVGDMVRLKYPAQDLDGTFTVTSQSISIMAGAPTAEEAKMNERF